MSKRDAEICRACGALCCKYVTIPLEEIRELERSWLEARGQVMEDGTWLLASRCPHLGEDDRCIIYPRRPGTCRLHKAAGPACRQLWLVLKREVQNRRRTG